MWVSRDNQEGIIGTSRASQSNDFSRGSQTPQYIGDRLQIFEEFEEWSRQKASKEGEDTSSNEGGDGEEDHGRVVLSVSESDCSICESDEDDEVKGKSSGKGDGYDNDCNVGSNMDDGGANQRRVATRRKSARFHSQKPNVPRLQAVWDFLSNEKKWKYIKVGGEYMVAGPDPDNGPVLQSQVRFLPLVMSARPRALQLRSRCFEVAPVLHPRWSLSQMSSGLVPVLLFSQRHPE